MFRQILRSETTLPSGLQQPWPRFLAGKTHLDWMWQRIRQWQIKFGYRTGLVDLINIIMNGSIPIIDGPGNPKTTAISARS